MKNKRKLSQREKDRRRKVRILKSKRFKEWWRARRTQSPAPRDPYRAFMIDLSLRASLQRKEVWKHRTNWSDHARVDFPLKLPTLRH